MRPLIAWLFARWIEAHDRGVRRRIARRPGIFSEGEDDYCVVLTFGYANGLLRQASAPCSKAQAIQKWRWHIGSGGFTPDSGRQAAVMPLTEVRRIGVHVGGC